MKIIYCHHAERAVDKRKPRSQDDDITENGIKDAELVADTFSKYNITAIYTSNFYRCKKTAQIINRFSNAPIFEEERFNEIGSPEDGETWKQGLARNIAALNDILDKYNDTDTIVCLTSGINLSAFVCWNLKKRPNKNFPFMGATSIAPIEFYQVTHTKYRERTFIRDLNALAYRKNKNYRVSIPTPGELKTYLKLELKNMGNTMQLFTNKLKREYYLNKLGALERAQDLGEIEMKKYLANRLSIDIMQLIKDVCKAENIDFNSVQTETALELTEEKCIENYMTYVERLFYIDTKVEDTLMLLYSTLVSYINYNDLSYIDLTKTCEMIENEEGNYYNGKLLYKL